MLKVSTGRLDEVVVEDMLENAEASEASKRAVSQEKMNDTQKTFYSNGTSKNDISIPRIDLEKLGIMRDKNTSKIRFKESRER